MSAGTRDSGEIKLLPGGGTPPAPAGNGGPAPLPDLAPPAQPALPAPAPAAPAQPPARVAGTTPSRQLSELPKDELEHLAEEYGLDPTAFKTRQHLVAGIHDRRQMIAALSREAMLDVIRWGRRPVTVSANKEQIAQEIARIKSMKFAGLSQRGLVALARMRGLPAADADPVPALVKRLKKQEGLFSRLNRKRRAMLGSMVSRLLGDEAATTDYQFLPGDGQAGPDPRSGGGPGPGSGAAGSAAGSSSIKEEIEESGLFGGITSRLKKSADAYVNQKLDEIEARIDRKLDEIDRRLGEWRDKEIANRIRILKITLWASVIVAVVSLVYAYVKVYFVGGR